MLSFVSLTWPSPRMLYKVQTGVFPISGFLVKSFINKNCYNFRTSNDIDMKLASLPKPENRNTMRLKMFGSDFILVNHDDIAIFPANLEEPESRIPNALSIILNFSLITTFYLINLSYSLHIICLENGPIFAR